MSRVGARKNVEKEGHDTAHPDYSAHAVEDERRQYLFAVQHALFAPEWSETVNENRVKHVWSCDACGYNFETTVYYPTAE